MGAALIKPSKRSNLLIACVGFAEAIAIAQLNGTTKVGIASVINSVPDCT